MKLSVIVPSYNGGAILAEHLPELCSQVAALVGGAEVLVVDDASNDPDDSTEALVTAQGPTARLLRQPENLGFAGSSNHGAEQARGELLLFLNNDMHPEPGCLATLVREFEEENGLFALSPVILNLEEGFPESTNRMLFRRGVFDLHFPGRHGAEAPAADEHRPLAYACGGAMICRRDRFLELGAFPEIHAPFYWEDADLGWRARRAGHEILETGSARVLHDHSRTIGALYTRSQVRRIYERNRLLFTWIHLAGPSAWLRHLALFLPRWLLALFRAHPAAVAPFTALARLPQVAAERKRLAGTRARAAEMIRKLESRPGTDLRQLVSANTRIP